MKKCSTRFTRLKNAVCVLISSAMVIGATPFIVFADQNNPTYYSVEDKSFNVATTITSSWDNHANVDFTFTNDGACDIHNWYFTFKTPYKIENIWNADIVETDGDGTYTIKNCGWNQDIAAGSSVLVGMTLSSETDAEIAAMPEWYLLNNKTALVDPESYEITYEEYSAWDEGFNGQLVLSTNEELDDWSFSFNSSKVVLEAYGVDFTANEDGSYVISNDGNNQNIYAGASYGIGILGVNSEEEFVLTDVTLSEVNLAFGLSDDFNANGQPDYLELIGITDTPEIIEPTVTPEPTVEPTVGPTTEPTVEPTEVPAIEEVLTLTASKSSIMCSSSKTTVYFYAAWYGEVASSVILVDSEGNVVGTMKDDGAFNSSGDDIKGDGIYSVKINLQSNNPYEAQYSAIATVGGNEINSDTLAIKFYKGISEQDKIDIQTVNNRLKELRAEILAGYYTFDEQYDMYMKALNELADTSTGSTLEYPLVDLDSVQYDEKNGCINFKYASGAWGSIDFDDYYNDDEEIWANGFTGSFLSLYSLDSSTSVSSYSYYSTYYQYADGSVSNEFIPSFTTEDLRTKLSGNLMIVIGCHGGLFTNPSNGNQDSILTTLQDTNVLSALDNEDLSEGIIAYRSNNDGFKVFPDFISKYYSEGDFENCFITVSACRFMGEDGNPDHTFAQTFIDLGAVAVYGYTNKTYTSYELKMNKTIIDDYYNGNTIAESIDHAKTLHGDNGYDWYHNHSTHSSSSSYDPLCNSIPTLVCPTGNEDHTINDIDIVNNSFESGLNGWNSYGDCRVIHLLSNINPTHAAWMAMITTGIGLGQSNYVSAGRDESSISQQLFIPLNAENISFSYNMVSEEPMEYVGSQFDDAFIACIITEDGTKHVIAQNSINSATWVQLTGVDFDGGDHTVYTTKWKTPEIDVSAYAGQVVTLVFAVSDVGDSAFDTAVLLDNVHFSFG